MQKGGQESGDLFESGQRSDQLHNRRVRPLATPVLLKTFEGYALEPLIMSSNP